MVDFHLKFSLIYHRGPLRIVCKYSMTSYLGDNYLFSVSFFMQKVKPLQCLSGNLSEYNINSMRDDKVKQQIEWNGVSFPAKTRTNGGLNAAFNVISSECQVYFERTLVSFFTKRDTQWKYRQVWLCFWQRRQDIYYQPAERCVKGKKDTARLHVSKNWVMVGSEFFLVPPNKNFISPFSFVVKKVFTRFLRN